MQLLYIEKHGNELGRKEYMTIKALPLKERPYEKLEKYGAKKLSNAELLAIIIKTGTKEKSAIQIAKEILSIGEKKKANDLKFINEFTMAELTKIKGIGRVKAIELIALCELVKRMSKPIDIEKNKIKNPEDVANAVMSEMRYEKIEVVKVMLLNNKNNIIGINEIARGKSNSACIEPKEVFTDAVKNGVPKIILIHNHPSGDPTPSKEDYNLTNRIEEASKIMGIELLDHIVIGDGIYKSIFSERNKMGI